MAGHPLRVLRLGRRPYPEVEALQEALRARVLEGDADAQALILVEHEPVVTLGRRATAADLRVPAAALEGRGVALHRSSRGGEATYHGPGQLVAYPVVTLHRGVRAHVEALAGAVVELARALGVEARYDAAHPGVWVGPRKLASIGVHVRRRVAVHGLALNVGRACLAGFEAIVPCGMPRVQMTCLEDELGAPLTVAAVQDALAARLLAALPAAPEAPAPSATTDAAP